MSILARFKTTCFSCQQPINVGDRMVSLGKTYSMAKRREIEMWIHECCRDTTAEHKAEVAQKMAASPLSSGRRNVRTRKGWMQR